MSRVNVIYHQFPHYRRPILRELVKSGCNEYRFFASLDDVSGIKVFSGDELVSISPLDFKLKGSRWVLKGYWGAVRDRSADVLLILGNPNMFASWVMAVAGRLTGKKVLFWAHGWLRPEMAAKRVVRNWYFGLAHRVLVYGERAVAMGLASGFSSERISVIYNSLDFERAQTALEKIEWGCVETAQRPQSLFENCEYPLIICTARLTNLCRLDLLLYASAILRDRGKPINVLLVGDGPERNGLEALAQTLGVSTVFFGSCYDEDTIATLIYYSDITVSPGKIGLTVIHSLTYGTPAITHGNFDEQMPEVEAIEPGVSGLFFERNDSNDLADKIAQWLERDVPRTTTRAACQRVIAEKWNPVRQRQLIDAAINRVMSDETVSK